MTKLDFLLVCASISDHALQRFKERWSPLDVHDLVPTTEAEWLEKFRSLLHDSFELNMHERSRVKLMLRHGYNDARYFRNKLYQMDFVVINPESSPIIKTVYRKRRH